ncbi:MAG: hypothetical protein HXS48_12480 [Theionarchaea archaeon]|nr:hypothetical protein [Theionarchaea archaeon]
MFEEVIPEDIEFDIVVRISPMREQTVRAKAKSVKRATPHVVEPKV